MTTNKTEVKRLRPAYSVDSVMRGYLFMEECENGAWVSLEDYEALQDECEKLRRDAERLDWIEAQAKKSYTGISFDYHRNVEDGYVLDHGYRFMRRHFASGFKDSLRKAIDAAIQETNP